MSMEIALQTFIAESRGLLHDMEESLLSLERTPTDAQLIDALFRAAHTIKGSAGLFGLDAIVEFTHVAESVLERLRSGEIATSKALVGVMLACADHLAVLIDAVADRDGRIDAVQLAHGHRLLQDLQPFLADSDAGPRGWRVTVQFGADVCRNGMDPASFIRYLAGLGQISDLQVDSSRLPDMEAMDPETCYLGFSMHVAGVEDYKVIEDVFEFVREDCVLTIEPGAGAPENGTDTASGGAIGAGELSGETDCRCHGQCEEAGQAARPPPQPSGGGTRRRAGPRRNRCGDDAADTGPRAGQDGSRRGRWHVDRRHTGARTPAERAAANRAGHRHRAAHAGEVHGVVRQTPERSVRNRRAGGESRRAAD